jgi:hypothetical protein
MPSTKDLFKLVAGETFEEMTRIQTADEVLEEQWRTVNSRYPLRSLGVGQSEVLLSEEERESHLHILGTTGEGKSKLIEHLIRGDIKQGNGVCLLDPTDRADTCYNILRYCASIGFEKVVLIEPHLIHTHKVVPNVQPFNYKPSYKRASVSNIFDTIRTVGQTKDATEVQRIKRFLPATLALLWNAGMTLHESLYFTDYSNKLYRDRRDFIIEQSDELDRHRIIVEDGFKNITRWTNFYQSTINRLEDYYDSTLDLIFGSKTGINFDRMITEGWVILVNLYSGLGFEPVHTRLLGTTVINEIIFALDRLRGRGWKGVYYLYIDEAGRYANRNLADLLTFKRKSGLRVTVAHQYFSQFEDKHVLDAIKNGCKTKVMFDTPNPADRLEMVKALGYGGDIPPALAQYANSNLPKRTAIYKPPKGTPLRFKVAEVSEVKMTQKAQDSYISTILNEYYKQPDAIRGEFEQRFGAASPRKRARADSAAGSNPVWNKAARKPAPTPKNGKGRSAKES